MEKRNISEKIPGKLGKRDKCKRAVKTCYNEKLCDVNWWINRMINRIIDRIINRIIDQIINRIIDQIINRIIDRIIDQIINRIMNIVWEHALLLLYGFQTGCQTMDKNILMNPVIL